LSIEEAKADMLGTKMLDYFTNKGVISQRNLEGIVSTQLISFFERFSKGVTEAHSRGNLVEYNWLKNSGGLHYNKTSRK
ncbi:MAG: hypothetical protein GWN01_04470, partial [Nitrosopumilaceae archaeon]|nr:hypothetical protein [Nitrosopumilaceae archaeon]NIU87552.1 hypothetical protein [Nitrosopumilaceae archaeon]NIV64826.1 hypothetical protein [Nitrosopumilaceae archaeon]NIX60808.1 hypothetical protein [Nitrosopumilaceae archaeon]